MQRMPVDTWAGCGPRTMVMAGLAQMTGRETWRAQARTGFRSARDRARFPTAAEDPFAAHGQIHERNGIWVVTVGGVWLGDYTRLEHALAAAESAPGHRR
jgi:hypothetical protein